MSKPRSASARAAAKAAEIDALVAEQNPEFQSAVVTIDHTSTRPDEHVVQKVVYSTQSLTGSVLALIDYYDEKHLLASEGTISQFQEAARAENPAFVYRTPENVQIVIDFVALQNLVAREGGSLLVALDGLVNNAGRVISDLERAVGAAVPLILFDYSSEG